MKLLDAIKNHGNPFEIPNCSRNDLPQFFLDVDFKIGVEIGVYKGEFSEKFCMAGLNLCAIDPWLSYPDYSQHWGQSRLNYVYEITRRKLKPYPNCTIIRKTSMEAVADFADNSLDFVYIDANHDFRYIAEDLAEWTKRVRSGGIVSGHDFSLPHVACVLTAYIGAYRIPNWFVLGLEHPKPGKKRDKWRSWMFIKP